MIKIDDSGFPIKLNHWAPEVVLSQLDMAMVQLGLTSLPYLFAREFGFAEGDLDKVEGYLHFWAVTGRMLGLEDR